MKRRLLLPAYCAVVIAACCAGSASAATSVLVLGGSEPLLSNFEAAFPATTVATHLQGIMSGDAAIAGGATVQSQDTFRAATAVSSFSGKTLMSWYNWPEDLANTQALLRKGWNYVVMIEDPYVASRWPEYYLEGTRAISAEARTMGSQLVLVMTWSSSGSTALASFGEMSYRVGDGIGAWVAPAGYAWNNLDGSLKDTGIRPTSRGSYLTAATIYSRIYNRSAKTSIYIPSGMTRAIRDNIADSALTTVQTEATRSHYAGNHTGPTHFVSPPNHKREIKLTDWNSSTERGIREGLMRIFESMKTSVSLTIPDRQTFPTTGFPYDFIQNRDISQVNKEKWVNFAAFDYQLRDTDTTDATNTMVAGIDRVIFREAYSEQSTAAYDVKGYHWDMGAFFVPVRVAWARLRTAQPSIPLQRDSHHMSYYVDECVAAMMYTLLTGRCSVEAEPAAGTSAWKYWFCRKTGYEIAWQYATLQERVPGFKVLPSSITKISIDANSPETLSVRFMYPPKQNVTVNISVDNTSAATIDKASLTFTPTNHSVAQTVRLTGIASATKSSVKATFTTLSTDTIYNGLSDDWTYSVERGVTPGVSWTAANQLSAIERGSLTVTAKLSMASTLNVSVPFAITGTAASDADYSISASPITIAAGATSGTATIRITDDSLIEGKETVILTMGTPINATKGAITEHTATITDDDVPPSGPVSKDAIVGQREANGAALGYYVNSMSSRVGTGGASPARSDRAVVMGYRLPTLPVGVKVTSATFTFEITGGRDSANLDPGLDVYLLKTANPDTSGTAFFYHGTSANTSSAKLVGSKYISIGQTTVAYADDQYDVELTLTGEALALLQSFYGNDHIPDQPEAFFRFNLNKDPAVSSYIRYEIDLADNESSLAINTASGTATPKQESATTAAADASALGESHKGSSCGVGNGLAVLALLSFFVAVTGLRRKDA